MNQNNDYNQGLDYATHSLNGDIPYVTFKNPPKEINDDDVSIFSDTLISEIIPAKLRELNLRSSELIENRNEDLDVIQTLVNDGKLDDYISHWFWIFVANVKYSEFFYIQKWIKYYLELLEKAKGEIIIQKTTISFDNEVDDDRILEAKKVPIESLYTGELKDLNGKLLGLCPFHDENTPSFYIFNDNNTFKCFGCQHQGDSIDFYMKLNNEDFINSVRRLTNG